MSVLKFENDNLMFYDVANKPQKIFSILPAENKSDLPQSYVMKIFNDTAPKLLNNNSGLAIIFLRIFCALLRKPQIHSVLRIGQWSLLDEMLAGMLPQFNEKNFLWCYVPHRPVGKFSHVNFVSAEVSGGGYYFYRKINFRQ